jgi:hypothetical protein
MRKIFSIIAVVALPALFFVSCSDEDLTPLYGEQVGGSIVIRSFSALQDSVQVLANGTPLKIGDDDTFSGRINIDYAFVFYDNAVKNIDVVNKATGESLRSYVFTAEVPKDTISFYTKDGIWLDDVLSNGPGTLSGPGKTGYKFIFPTMNRFSNSGYDGAIDAIIRKTNGEVLGVAENITKDDFSGFVEFAYSSPPILNVELVKHGTTQSFIEGQQIIVQMVMQNNKSRLVVLNEKANESGAFSGVDGIINLVDLFPF